LGCKRRGSGTELAEGRDGNTQQFTCSTPKSSASKKAARHFPESEENGFGGAGRAVRSAAASGKFATITANGFCSRLAPLSYDFEADGANEGIETDDTLIEAIELRRFC
jgi:hypothetical protein